MMKTYKVITAKKEKEIEDTINELVADGREVEYFKTPYTFTVTLSDVVHSIAL